VGLAFVPPLSQAALNGMRAFFKIGPRARWSWLKRAAVTALLHFLQPAARLCGRVGYGLTPWRRRGSDVLAFPRSQAIDLWSETHWQSAEERLSHFENALRKAGASVARGGDFDRWDLEVRGGLLGTARLLMVIEEHGNGRQYVRLQLWPMAAPATFVIASLFALVAMIPALDLRWTAWALLNLPAVLLLARTLYESASALALLKQVIGTANGGSHGDTATASQGGQGCG
jgi:hypothetical protein